MSAEIRPRRSEVGFDQGQHFIVMDLVEGASLENRILEERETFGKVVLEP